MINQNNAALALAARPASGSVPLVIEIVPLRVAHRANKRLMRRAGLCSAKAAHVPEAHQVFVTKRPAPVLNDSLAIRAKRHFSTFSYS